MPINQALRRLKQEDNEFETSLNYNSEFHASLSLSQSKLTKK
jgi:hypothetical protein